MQNELLKTFNDKGEFSGDFDRDTVHINGLWHETFHCWFVSKKNDKYYIHFQIRSNIKKDYPGLLDITAAGHILSKESVTDGIREVHEELGVYLSLDDLIYLGKIPDEIIQDNIIDKEYAHVFLYIIPEDKDIDYTFQIEEVSGVVKIEMSIFEKLWRKEIKKTKVTGVVLDKNNVNVYTDILVDAKDFLPHENSYITIVLNEISKNLI